MNATPGKITIHVLSAVEATRMATLMSGEDYVHFHVYEDGSIEIPLSYGCIRLVANKSMEIL